MTWCEMLEVRVSAMGFVACMLQGRRSPINGPSGQAGNGRILTSVFFVSFNLEILFFLCQFSVFLLTFGSQLVIFYCKVIKVISN